MDKLSYNIVEIRVRNCFCFGPHMHGRDYSKFQTQSSSQFQVRLNSPTDAWCELQTDI